MTIRLTFNGTDRFSENCSGLKICCKNKIHTSDGHSLYTLMNLSSLNGLKFAEKDFGIPRDSKNDGPSILHKTWDPFLLTMTLSS
jgi:hypothetical protein